MIDGTYNLTIGTPLGTKSGTASLRTEGNKVYANIDAPIIGKQQAIATADGDTFTAAGSFKVMFAGTVDYTLKGEVADDNLNIVIDSNKGTFNITGVRV